MEPRRAVVERSFPGGKLLKLLVGDITRVPVDAMVNAANAALAGGGGVDGAIHRVGGPSIMRELDQIRGKTGGCPTGGAVATAAGLLPARFVFHAVGPVYRDGRRGEPESLASCYRSCFSLAARHQIQSISFPSISTGAYGYPVGDAARIALREVRRHLKQEGGSLREVIFVLFTEADHRVYADSMDPEE